MSVLTDIVAGTRPVLHNCRLEGSGADAYGRDDIAALLQSVDFTDPAHDLEASGSALLANAAGDTLVAELVSGAVKRLWLLTEKAPGASAPGRTNVPFDPDMDQRGGHIAFEPIDFPELVPGHADRISRAATVWLSNRGEKGLRALRPFVLRAFSVGDTAAALIAVCAMRSDAPGLIWFNVAVIAPAGAEPHYLVDHAGLTDALARSWSPRL